LEQAATKITKTKRMIAADENRAVFRARRFGRFVITVAVA
jgi:hypothetical protein